MKIRAFNLPDFVLDYNNLPLVEELDHFIWGFITTHKESSETIHHQNILAECFYLMFVQNSRDSQKYSDVRLTES